MSSGDEYSGGEKESNVIHVMSSPGTTKRRGGTDGTVTNDMGEKVVSDSMSHALDETATTPRERMDVSGSSEIADVLIPAAHAITKWGDQAWTFVIPLVLVSIYPSTLAPAALYALFSQVCIFFTAQNVGAWIDNAPRIIVIRYSLITQTFSTFFSGIFLLVLLAARSTISEEEREEEDDTHLNWPTMILFALMTFSSTLSMLGGIAREISLEKDWLPSLYVNDHLLQMNGKLKRIDLIGELGAPLVVGLIFSLFGLREGFITVLLVQVLSFGADFWILQKVYETHLEQLARVDQRVSSQTVLSSKYIGNPFSAIRKGWSSFSSHACALPIVAHACLWMTVLSSHGILLTAWMKDGEGGDMSDVGIGLVRGLGALSGLYGSYTFPYVVHKFQGVVPASRNVLLGQALFVLPCGIFFGRSLFVFLLCLILSRYFLYAFLVGQTQILQQGIGEHERGLLNSVETSLLQVAMIVVNVLALLFSHPGSSFSLLVWLSVVSVVLGASVFAYWTHKDTANTYHAMPRPDPEDGLFSLTDDEDDSITIESD